MGSLPVSLVFEKQSNCTEVTATVCIYVPVLITVLQWLCCSVWLMSSSCCLVTACYDNITEGVIACLVAHNMRFWCILSFYSPVCARQKKMSWTESPVKSQIWAAMFVKMSWFDLYLSFIFTKKHAGHYACLLPWGPFNLSECSMLIYLLHRKMWNEQYKLHDWCNLTKALYMYRFNCSLNILVCFIWCNLYYSPEERWRDIEILLDALWHQYCQKP